MKRAFVAFAFLAGVLSASAATSGDDRDQCKKAKEALLSLEKLQAAPSGLVLLEKELANLEKGLAELQDLDGDEPDDVSMLALLQDQPAPPAPPAAPAPPGVYVWGTKGSYLGVGVADIDTERARELKLKDEHGVEITRVEEDSPASKAGLQKGDVLLEYQGQRIEGIDQFQRMVRETPAGRPVKLHVMRNGASHTITATIGERKGHARVQAFGLGENFDRDMKKLQEQMQNLRIEIPDVPMGMMSWRTGTLGITAEALNPQLAEFFGVKQGVLVREVNKDSAAEKAGLKAGDVIVKVDQTAVSSPQQISGAVRSQHGKGNTVPITVVRNKQEMVLNVTVDRPHSSEWTSPRPKAIVTPRPTPNRFTL